MLFCAVTAPVVIVDESLITAARGLREAWVLGAEKTQEWRCLHV